MDPSADTYQGRRWLLAARATRLRPVIDWGLRQPSWKRAMLPPLLGGFACVLLCRVTIALVANGAIAPLYGYAVTTLVLWPLGLVLALGADLVRRERRLRSGSDE